MAYETILSHLRAVRNGRRSEDALREALDTLSVRIPPHTLGYLLVLEASKRPLTNAELAQAQPELAKNITYQLRCLAAAGLIELENSTWDQRANATSITPAGRELLARVAKVMTEGPNGQ